MHDCELCGEACDCDMEDHYQPQPDDCDHVCNDEDDYDEGYEAFAAEESEL